MATQLPQGVRRLRTLTGHNGAIGRIGWSPDGRLLATPSLDGTVRIWETDSGECMRILPCEANQFAAAFGPEGRILATGGYSGTKLWDVASGELRTSLDRDVCYVVAFSPNNRILATAHESSDVKLWDPATGRVLHRLTGHKDRVLDVAFDVAGGMLATGSPDGTIILWDIPNGQPHRTLIGTSLPVFAVAFHPGEGTLASAGFEGIVMLWDVATGIPVSILEGQTGFVRGLSFSPDGRLLASTSDDGTVRLWDTSSGQCLAVLPGSTPARSMVSVAFHPQLPFLAVVGSDSPPSSGQRDSVVQLWEVDVDLLFGHPATPSVAYTTAKIVLVGEPGVGKTGLGWRLAHREFVEHSSTHGQQFWQLDELCSAGADGVKREAILWDLAGQPDYRLIHALYLDDVDLALVLFDPTRDDDPLRGVEYWLRQLGRDRPIILVAGRCDVSAPRLTRTEIEAFCADRGIAGYVATSALRGEGVAELVERMRAAIRWDEQPTTVTTQTFKRIRDEVLELKETPRGEGTILSAAQLRARLDRAHTAQSLTDAELLTAVRHLSNHGYVAQLRTSHGEPLILLAPELLNNLAASMVLAARRNPKGLGSLEEQRMLTDGYRFPGLAWLSAEEREVLLVSTVATFLAHSVCFRATDPLTARSYLVFPELINFRKLVITDEQPIEEGVAYTVSGAVGNVYASLVVLLGYTSTFTRTSQWRDHAQYVVGDGLVCGLRKEAEREGELDFVLYFSTTVGAPIRTLFQNLFESFLSRRELTVRRYEVVRCAEGHQLNRAVVRERLAEGDHHPFCSRCGQQVALPRADTPIELTHQQADERADQRWAASQRSCFEQVLFRLTTYVRQEGIPAPECFISYAWGEDRHERWVEHQLAPDLANAGITVVLDRWENARIGASVSRFVERIARADRVVVVGTPRYRTKYDNGEPMGGFVVAAEGDLIGQRMLGSEAAKESVLPVLLDGTAESAFPPLLRGRVHADFRPVQRYLPTAFDLIVSLYQISTHEPIRQLRRQLVDERGWW